MRRACVGACRRTRVTSRTRRRGRASASPSRARAGLEPGLRAAIGIGRKQEVDACATVVKGPEDWGGGRGGGHGRTHRSPRRCPPRRPASPLACKWRQFVVSVVKVELRRGRTHWAFAVFAAGWLCAAAPRCGANRTGGPLCFARRVQAGRGGPRSASRDGLSVDSYRTLPIGCQTNRPLMVFSLMLQMS